MQEDSFTLSVYYKNEHRDFEAVLRVFYHTHKIAVKVGDQEVIFEPDEERNYRAVIPPETATLHKTDVGLLTAIAAELETALK